jgi:hypothetical protein
MQTLSQLCFVPAKHLGETDVETMRERGRVPEGTVADVVIFNPAKVEDSPTYAIGAFSYRFGWFNGLAAEGQTPFSNRF